MRQLEGSECSYADYEERARQLELQRPGWDGSTQTEREPQRLRKTHAA